MNATIPEPQAGEPWARIEGVCVNPRHFRTGAQAFSSRTRLEVRP